MFSSALRRTLPHVLLAALSVALCATGCGDPSAGRRRDTTSVAPATSAAPAMSVRDDFGAPVLAGPPPARIVSLNPTTTELLFALGVGGRVVGRTHWDVYPDAARAVPDLGDGIRPNVEVILAARPQLVVLYASADNRPAADALTSAGIRVLSLKIDRVEQFFHAVRLLGAATGATTAAATIVDSVSRTLDHVRATTAGAPRPRVLWPLFSDPLYVIGGGSFMSQLVDIAGGTNVFADVPQPSPQVSREEVLRRDADVVIASPTAVGKLRADAAWRGLSAVRANRVFVEDTSVVERPSVRLGEAAMSIALLLHPELRDRLVSRPR